MKKVIVTGATGMVGKGVLLECLDHPEIGEVLAVGRNSLEMDHPKLKELLLPDFSDFSQVQDQLNGYDAVYYCMGVSANGLDEAKYTKLTYDYALSLAKAFYKANPNGYFNYVSGQGTDSSEKGRMMWARVKGKTENDILKMGFKQAVMFRPGGIIALRGIKSRTPLYQTLMNTMGWLLHLIKKISPNSIVNTTEIGLAMINTVLYDTGSGIVDPKDIIQLAKK